jgi:hypothetical protein
MTEGHSTLLKSEDGEREREKKNTVVFIIVFRCNTSREKKKRFSKCNQEREREEKKHSLRSTHDYSLSMTTR